MDSIACKKQELDARNARIVEMAKAGLKQKDIAAALNISCSDLQL